MTDIKCSLKNETELTQCVKFNPDSVEEGLKVIDTFFKLSNGRQIDLLAIDKDNTLVIMELKVDVDNNQLVQSIAYYDWVLNNFDALKRIFPNTHFESVPPRIILIARDFTEDIILLAKYFKENINITLYRYIAVKKDNEKVIICNEKNIPDAPEIFNPTTENELFNYIDDASVKAYTKKLIDEIRTLDPKVSAEVKNWRGFSIKYNGRVFGYISMRKKYINCGVKKDVYNNESWENFENINSENDFKKTFNDFKETFSTAKNQLDGN